MSLAQLSDVLSLRPHPQQRLPFTVSQADATNLAASFVLTKEAEGSAARVLFAIRRGRPAVFWVSGEHGSGKTHFLVYLNSLLTHPETAAEAFKHDLPDVPTLTVALEVRDGSQLAQTISAPLWERLKVPRHLSDLWRRLGAEVGLRATLEEVGRNGFKRTVILIDDSGE